MAACGSLQHIFENPLPENPTMLLESLSSWKPVKPIEQPLFTEKASLHRRVFWPEKYSSEGTE
jgi:hypothetical protein